MEIFRFFAGRAAHRLNGADNPVYSRAQRAAWEEWEKLLRRVSHDDILALSPEVRKAANVKMLPKDTNVASYMGKDVPEAYAFAAETPFSRSTIMHVSERATQNRAMGLLTTSHELLHAFQFKHLKPTGAFAGVKYWGDSIANYLTEKKAGALFNELLQMQSKPTDRFLFRLKFFKWNRNAMLRSKLKPSAVDKQVREKLKTVPDNVLGVVKNLLAGEVQAHQASRDFVVQQGLKLKRAEFSEDVAFQRVYQRLWSLLEQEERRRGLPASS